MTGCGDNRLPALIRLACVHCDREDCDEIDAIPADWSDVEESAGYGELDWWTHMGVCPDCFVAFKRPWTSSVRREHETWA